MIIDGKKIRNEILESVKEGVARLPFTPVFCDVLVGTDPVSTQYINMKAKTAESVGIHFHHANFKEEITTEELILEIKKLNNVPFMCGLIVQLPLPSHIDRNLVLDAIDPSIDVDCLSKSASDIFYNGDITIAYPTALSCMSIIDRVISNLSDKNIVVIGQGMLVGKPLVHLLKMRGLEVNIVTRTTLNKEYIIKNADLIISATGQGKLINGSMIKKGCVVIDAGTSESNGGIVGDVDLDSVKDVASFVSPVPGGVGPVTVAMLLQNVLKVAQKLKR